MTRDEIEQLVFAARLAVLALSAPRDAETQRIIADALDNALKPFAFVVQKKEPQRAA